MIRLLILLFLPLCLFSQTKVHDVVKCHCEKCLDLKIGRMIMAGFRGVEPSVEICDAIRKNYIGGVILFDRDVSDNMGERNIRSPKQLVALVKQLRALTTRPLMVAIDQEGGRVNRLKSKYGFPSTVSAAHQGRVASVDSASYWAAATAQTLVECGININFVPCVDLNVNPQNPIIGRVERSFSSDPDSVYMLASQWVYQHHLRGVATSLKHFPGHGSSLSDSHLGLVDVTSTWSDRELIPYRRFVDDGYGSIVMVGHLFNSKIDPDYPASLSHKTITELLRQCIGFDGVVATDDLNMGAIVDNYTLERALVLAINAGANLIIVGNNSSQYQPLLAARCHAIIKSKVASGEILLDRIDDSYSRLQRLVLSL